MSEVKQVPAVYSAIIAVATDLAKNGITKDRKNQLQNYQFRGIDDVFNALSPLLARHGLCILPRIKSRAVTERQTNKGGVIFYVVVEAEFDFVAMSDGSLHTIATIGEAMDSSDKATNKAMSAAYKYAAFMAFAIPTEGDNDADLSTPQVQPVAAKPDAKPATDAPTAPDAKQADKPVSVQQLEFEKVRGQISDIDSAVRCDKAFNHVMHLRSRGAISQFHLGQLINEIAKRKSLFVVVD